MSWFRIFLMVFRRVAVAGQTIALATILISANLMGQQNETAFRSPQLSATAAGSSRPGVNQSAPSPPGQLQNSGQGTGTLGNPPIQVGSQLTVQQPDGFVPDQTPQGFVPVNPRQDAQTGESEMVGQFQSDVPSRSESDLEILELLRSGKLDEAFRADQNGTGVEVIRQRYPNGKVQIERYVAQDEEGNFYNDGPWKLFNQRGQVLAQGQFEKGVMTGTWERWHPVGSGGVFQTKPFTLFKGPFSSTATFINGKLDGVWAMFDQFQRKILEIPYKNGLRDGTATWWYPESTKMRVINFKEGLLDGPLFEWDEQNLLVRNEEYIGGKKVIRKTTFYRPNQKQSESFYLDAEQHLEGDDSWWEARPAPYIKTGTPVQHGPTYAWHANGQPKMRGSYQNNIPVGDFVWWHDNGQRELVGSYRDGLKVGQWLGWHANGVKSFQGTFENDRRVGLWIWWDEDGQVRAKKDFDIQPESTDVLAEPQQNPDVESDDRSGISTEPPTEGFSEMEEITPIDAGNFLPDKPKNNELPAPNDSESGIQFRDPAPDENNSNPSPIENPGDGNSDGNAGGGQTT